MPTEITAEKIQITTKELRELIECAERNNPDYKHYNIIGHVVDDADFEGHEYKYVNMIYKEIKNTIKNILNKLNVKGDVARILESTLHVIFENIYHGDVLYAAKLAALYLDDIHIRVNSEYIERLRNDCK